MKTKDDPVAERNVRPATQADRFYEGNPDTLSREVDSLLTLHANDASYDRVAAIIVPHAGYEFSGYVAAAAYMALPKKHHYKRIILLGPSHYEWLDGASVNSEADAYATPLGEVKVDSQAVQQIIAADSVFTYRPKAHDREHCLEVQLPFLQRLMDEVPPIVPIIISTNDYTKLERIAHALRPFLNDETLFIISSDFSHYPSYQDAKRIDARTAEALKSGDVEHFIATLESNSRQGIRNLSTSACGEYPIITLLLMLQSQPSGAFDQDHYEMKHLLYQNSGDSEYGQHDRVVGYHAFAVLRKGAEEDPTAVSTDGESEADNAEKAFTLTKDEKRLLKQIALESIQTAFDSTAATPATKEASQHPILLRKCGAFVTLHKHGRLRGCIGHFGEDVPLKDIVWEMARAAAFEDPRFPELSASELKSIDIEISVLTPMRRIHSLKEFQLHRHGIYIKKGRRSGTFLPQVADETNWTKEEFVGYCSRDKAGLGWDGWRDAELYVYEAIVF